MAEPPPGPPGPPAPSAPTTPAGVKGETRIEEPSPRQRTIARRVAEARATVPDLELAADIDMEAALALTAQQGCSTTAILIRACALALREQPRVNGGYRDGRFELYSRINIGITAVADDAFLTPVVFDADGKSLVELTGEIDLLIQRAATGQLSPPELAGATFTVTDLGEHQLLSASAIVAPPQAAALAAGAIREVPVIRGAEIVPGHAMTITLACDHRIVYQSQGAGFLAAVKRRIEHGAP